MSDSSIDVALAEWKEASARYGSRSDVADEAFQKFQSAIAASKELEYSQQKARLNEIAKELKQRAEAE